MNSFVNPANMIKPTVVFTVEQKVRQKVAVNAKKDLMKEKFVQKKDKKQKLKKDKEIIKDSD